jgi:hypothetical protein
VNVKARLPLLAALTAVASLGAVVGCGHSGARLRDAASADLNCPPSRLHILGASRVKDVNGCGHSATYKYEDEEWIMTIRDGQPVSTVAAPLRGAPPPVTPAQPVQPTGQPASGTPSMPPSSPPPPAGRSL